MPLDNKSLALEMAAINMVNSEELAENSNIVSDIVLLQNRVRERMGVVEDVKDIILEMKDHEVNPDAAVILDKQLERQGALKSQLVSGVECLGRDISPSEWRRTRIASCESFLGEAVNFLESSTKRLFSGFSDAKTMLLMSIKDSRTALTALKEEVDGITAWDDTTPFKIDLGYHLFNRFKVGGVLKEDWEAEFTRVNNIISALTRIYYKENSDGLNDIFRLFGGVRVCKTPDDVARYLHNIPNSLKNQRFAACTINDESLEHGRVFRSPAIMGDRYFTSTVLDPKTFDKTNEGFEQWLNEYTRHAGTKFSGMPEKVLTGSFITPALKKDTILSLIDKMFSIVESWEKTYDVGEKEIASVKEMKNSFDELRSIDGEEQHVDLLCEAFERMVFHNQRGLLDIRSSITKYIALLITALIQLSRLSSAARRT